MVNPFAVLGSAGVGAAAMYFFDPERGHRRRALARDQCVSACRRSARAASIVGQDSRNRLYGLFAETWSTYTEPPPDDDVLVQRVRSQLGHFIGHRTDLIVTALNGHVTLHGPILAKEVQPLLAKLRKIRGVRSVHHKLDIHLDPEEAPELSGDGRTQNAHLATQTRWSPAAQAALGMAALGLTGACLLSRTRTGLFVGGAISTIAAQAVTALMNPGHRGQIHRRVSIAQSEISHRNGKPSKEPADSTSAPQIGV